MIVSRTGFIHQSRLAQPGGTEGASTGASSLNARSRIRRGYSVARLGLRQTSNAQRPGASMAAHQHLVILFFFKMEKKWSPKPFSRRYPNGSGVGLTTGVGAGSPPYTPLPGAASPDQTTPLCHPISSNDGSYNLKKGKKERFPLVVFFFRSSPVAHQTPNTQLGNLIHPTQIQPKRREEKDMINIPME